MNSESTDNKQANDNNVNSPLSWIIASLGQVAHFTSVVIRNVLATSGWVRFAHTAPYAKSAHNSQLTKFAFTLAETLVVMGIIGVVAALTIPNLNQSTGDREKVAKVKKIYSNLEDAYGRATAVYGPFDTWFINDVDEKGKPDNKAISIRLANRITEFMKISKDCGYDGAGCFSDSYKNLEGEINGKFMNSPMNMSSVPMFLLADGTALSIYKPSNTTFGRILVDIDGIKGSNTYGKDMFSFDIFKSSIVPERRGLSNGSLKSRCFETGYQCTDWVIETGNMDYLKANKGVCPNGTQLTWENPSCK